MVATALLGVDLLGGTTVVGALLACVVAAIVFSDARSASLEHAPAWALGVGTASLACFVVGDALAVPLWIATAGTRDGAVVATTPFTVLAIGVAVGIVLTLVVLGGYGLGTRRAARA